MKPMLIHPMEGCEQVNRQIPGYPSCDLRRHCLVDRSLPQCIPSKVPKHRITEYSNNI